MHVRSRRQHQKKNIRHVTVLGFLLLKSTFVIGLPLSDSSEVSKKDTLKVKGYISGTGLYQSGDENRYVSSLLSVITFGNHKNEIEPLTSIAYSGKPGTQVEGEFLENIILRHHQEASVYPALGLSVDKSHLRKIEYRWGAGATIVFNIIRNAHHHTKLGIGYNHEFTQFDKGAFIPELASTNNHVNRHLDQVYARLKGSHDLVKGKIIFSYDFFIQPSLQDFTDYRWTTIENLDFPFTKKMSLRASAVSSYETFVATNIPQNNFRLTYGISISF